MCVETSNKFGKPFESHELLRKKRMRKTLHWSLTFAKSSYFIAKFCISSLLMIWLFTGSAKPSGEPGFSGVPEVFFFFPLSVNTFFHKRYHWNDAANRHHRAVERYFTKIQLWMISVDSKPRGLAEKVKCRWTFFCKSKN